MIIPKTPGIYGLSFINRGIVYVGSTVNLHNRWLSHRWHLRKQKHFNTHVQRIWDLDGELSASYVIIEECNADCLVDREKHYIDLLNPACNMCIAEPNTRRGVKQTEEHLRKRIASQMANSPHYGTPEFRQKLKDAAKGRVVQEHIRLKGNQAWTGRKHSEESLEKMRVKARERGDRLAGKPISEEHRKNIIAGTLRANAERRARLEASNKHAG